ncbi:MAG: response regulator [Candidatus Eremiobacteraeota bacterium]|nr:response regulator [Candidatus Eremiobacteraeota bacterium]MCW5868626.1 response regulator [Candidatus Eremiobacteraeota bacterium]
MQYILLLEDDEDFRELLADLLSGEGYVVVEADLAQKAIDLAQTRPFHLILSDVRMAGELDGVAAIEKIQQACPGIRSIIMTGFADMDVPLRAARLKADDYMMKPFDMRELSRVVSSVLQRREEVAPSLLSRALSSAHKAGKWLFDRQVQEAHGKRGDFYQQFFVLIRSNRMSAEEAYEVFRALEQVEWSTANAGWSALAQAYEGLQKKLMAVIGGERLALPEKAGIGMREFRRLYQRLQSGKVDAGHFQNAVQLYHNPELRKSDLQAYATFCWLWEEEPQQKEVDPFLGLHFGQLTLQSCLLGVAEVKLYALTRAGQPCAERILCFPVDQTTTSLNDELSRGRAEYLKEAYGHHFLLYAGDPGVTSLAKLIPEGTSWARIWGLMRPMFVKLGDHHQAGACSGCFASSQVRFGAEGEATILDFGPQGFHRAHFLLTAADQQLPPDVRFLLCAAPEALLQENPTHRSDQFVAGRILLEALRVSAPELRLLNENAAESLWVEARAKVGEPVTEVLRRLCHPKPAFRYPDIWEAMQALDMAGVPAPA